VLPTIGAIALLVAAAGLRFVQIDAQSLWYDEGVSAGMIGQDPIAIIRAAAADFHPPLYYLILAAWAKVLGDSTWAIRGLSACAGVVLVVATWRLATHLFGATGGWLAGFWATVSPLGIAFSQELRMYMPVAAAVAVAAWCSVIWLDDASGKPTTSGGAPLCRARTWSLWGYVLAATVALYLQYVAVLGLGAIGLYGLARARGWASWRWLGANAAVAGLFAPWLPVFHHQLTVGKTATTAHTAVSSVLPNAFGALLVGIDGAPVATGAAAALLAAIVVFGTAVALCQGSRGSLPALLLIVPLAGVTAYAAWKSVFEVRYVLVALPAVAMSGAAGVSTLSDALSRIVAGPATKALAVMGAGTLIAAICGSADLRYYMAPLHPHDDYRGLAQTIRAQAEPNDAVLLYPPGQDHVFNYYYRGPDAVVGLPLQRPPDSAQVQATLASLASTHPRIWVVDYGATEADPPGLVATWLAQHAFVSSHRWFGSVQLLLYATEQGHAPPEASTHARFGNGAELTGYTLPEAGILPGSTLRLVLTWRDVAPIDARYTVFTHLLDGNNKVVTQHDGEPAGSTRPTTTWQVGEQIVDLHGMVLPSRLPPGAYTVEVGMYASATLVRAPLLPDPGQAATDRVLLGKVTVLSP